MRKCIFSVLLACTLLAEGCSHSDIRPFEQIRGAVSRLLSYPGYTVSDEKILNGAGDLAAVAVIMTVSIEDLQSHSKTKKILQILSLAFEAPQQIRDSNRRPTAAMLLLDHIEKAYCGKEKCNEIENVRFEIQHNTSTGKPLEYVSLESEPPVDWEHMQWVASILNATVDIKQGMTRKDLLRVFTAEGGISMRTQQTYVLKACPYIHVDVEFSPVQNTGAIEGHGSDRITKISKPYLDGMHMD
jgi:hypothetical protein